MSSGFLKRRCIAIPPKNIHMERRKFCKTETESCRALAVYKAFGVADLREIYKLYVGVFI